MATFEGTETEFIKFVGPLIRNMIQGKTRPFKKKANGICSACSQARELHAAHVKGNDRLQVIRTVLAPYKTGSIVKCDLEQAVQAIIDAHMPIADAFKFICEPCHKDYDAGRLQL